MNKNPYLRFIEATRKNRANPVSEITDPATAPFLPEATPLEVTPNEVEDDVENVEGENEDDVVEPQSPKRKWGIDVDGDGEEDL
jgi:hypothetical protein